MPHHNIIERDFSLNELFGDIVSDEADKALKQVHSDMFATQIEAMLQESCKQEWHPIGSFTGSPSAR